MSRVLHYCRFDVLAFLCLALYPLTGADDFIRVWTGQLFGSALTTLFILGILALGLNVVLGYTGILHLGIAAFFGIGAYITGILIVKGYPFQVSFPVALLCATVGAALMGGLLGAPTLRLRGDYLALVTLGFGEVVRFTLKNLEEITGGTRGLNPLPPPPQAWADCLAIVGLSTSWQDFEAFYFLALLMLLLAYVLLRRLESSQLGRAWVAVREDELAATCMGLPAARVKLSAFALGAALAGAAGSLYAVHLTTTADPDSAYAFNRSVLILCCVILGGLGSLRGTLLGVVLLVGFEMIATPAIDQELQRQEVVSSAMEWVVPEADIKAAKERLDGAREPAERTRLTLEMTVLTERRELVRRLSTFSSWTQLLFGAALVLMMRFRPEGLLPSRRVQIAFQDARAGGS